MNKSADNASKSVLDEAQAVNRLFERMNELYHAVASNRGLTGNAFSVLYALYECDGLSQKQISHRAYIPKQTVSYTTKKLREEGLVSEEAIDGRESRLSLTQCGTKRAEKDIAPVMDAERSTLASYSDADRKALIDMFEDYVSRLENSFIESGLIAKKQK